MIYKYLSEVSTTYGCLLQNTLLPCHWALPLIPLLLPYWVQWMQSHRNEFAAGYGITETALIMVASVTPLAALPIISKLPASPDPPSVPIRQIFKYSLRVER